MNTIYIGAFCLPCWLRSDFFVFESETLFSCKNGIVNTGYIISFTDFVDSDGPSAPYIPEYLISNMSQCKHAPNRLCFGTLRNSQD